MGEQFIEKGGGFPEERGRRKNSGRRVAQALGQEAKRIVLTKRDGENGPDR